MGRLAAQLRRPRAGVDRPEAPPALGGYGGYCPDRVSRVHGTCRRVDGRVSRLTSEPPPYSIKSHDMNSTSDFYLFGVPGMGMILVSVLAVIVWRRASGADLLSFWAGAGLWAAAVALKVAFSLLVNQAAVSLLNRA